MKQKYNKLIEAYTPKQVLEFIKEIGTSNIRWENVGNRRNNLATINIGTDPAAGVTERVTNAIDAVLEREWENQGKPKGFLTPRRASEEWFKIDSGKISSIEDAKDKRIISLSDKVQVTLYESGRNDKPTVEIRDKGIGLEPEDFSKTILELNGNNKIGKLFLMGAFGQGGSTALAYNNNTIIISKPAFPKNEKHKNKIAFTVVRMNEGDYNVDKQGWYEYMVDKSTGQPFVLDVDDETFEPGTLVRHILMDLGRFRGVITTPSNSLWYVAHNYLFDPILPFTISDRRKERTVNRTVTGNNRLLTYTENLEYKNQATLTFKTGKVTLYWWVLNTLGTDPRERIRNYTAISQPIVITHNGQKQGTLNNGIIKKNLKLPYLDRYLIVQIETDELDNESKRQLFSSTRESIKTTSISDDLTQLTIDTLSADDKLKILDQQRKQRYFTKDDAQVLDSLKRRLVRRINQYLRNTGSGTSITTSTFGESSSPKERPEIPVEDPPTFFEVTTKSPIQVYANQNFSIKFKTDAHPNYIKQVETFAAFINPYSLGAFSGTARVNQGYGIAYFKTNEDVEIGNVGQVTLELRPLGQHSISSTIDVEIVKRPETSGTGSGKNKSPNIRVDFINAEHSYFIEHHWDENSVADVLSEEDEVIIFVSEENKNLQSLVERAQRKNDVAVSNIKNKYLEHISFHAFLVDKNNPDKILSEEEENISSEAYEKLKKKDLENASETVCGMINDFFDSIIIESIED